jgi:RNA polymerase sigma-70 factor, ECF subfamily
VIDADVEREILALARSVRPEDRGRALERLVSAVHAPLLAVCANVTRHRADAEDALQETYLAVHRALPAFRGEARLGTWVYRIALRAAVRQRARGRRHVTEPLGVDPADPRAGTISRTGDADRLDRALATLSAEHRAVLALFCVEEHTHEQIADVLGLPVGTVWSRLHHARKRLAEALGPRGAE